MHNPFFPKPISKIYTCLYPIHNYHSRIFLGKIYSAKPVSFGSPTAFRQRDTTNRAVRKNEKNSQKVHFRYLQKTQASGTDPFESLSMLSIFHSNQFIIKAF
jgi:hypothetical protein